MGTDRVNENILIQEGLCITQPRISNGRGALYNCAYFNRQCVGERDAEGVKDYSTNSSGYRDIRMEDGLLLPVMTAN